MPQKINTVWWSHYEGSRNWETIHLIHSWRLCVVWFSPRLPSTWSISSSIEFHFFVNKIPNCNMNSSRTPTGRLSLKILERIRCLILRTTVKNLLKIGSVKNRFKLLFLSVQGQFSEITPNHRSLIIFIVVLRIKQAIPFNFLDIYELIL